MKFSYSLLGLLLLTSGAAWAQQPISTTTTESDSVIRTVEVYKISPEKNPMLTPADSARERARKENARRLRQTGKNNPAHPIVMPPASGQAASPTPTPPSTTTPQPAPATPTESAADIRRREEATRKAAEADKKREKTLYKRAKKSS